VDKLKTSMAKALVPFYPLAGRLGTDSNGRLEINCNAEGALFVVAHSDRTVEDFSGSKSSPELGNMLCPRVQPSSIILAVQVTFFKCGGVVLGTAGHHAVVDGSSMFHFIRTWASYCRDGESAMVELPCHDRSLLRARSPPVIRPETIPMFCSKLTMHQSSGVSVVATEVFTFSRDQLQDLKRYCGGVSTFCAVSALVWRCVCVARPLDPDATTRMNFPVDVRSRLKPPLPEGYFGNGVVNVFATAAVKDVVSGTLASIASRVKATTEPFDDELLRSAVDYFEVAERGRRPENSGNLPDTELRMNSWYHLRTYEADFGWGKPRVMTRAEAVRGGWAYLLDAGCGDGSAHLLISLEAATLKKIERAIARCLVLANVGARL
jgi:shikimate O-hydroxycinnamoyltransferase